MSALVSPAGSSAPRYTAALGCLATGQPVSGGTEVGAFLSPLTDGAHTRGEDHVQERGLGDALDLYAGQLSQGSPLGSLPAQTLQVG
jgi:hypothetical protein